MTDLPQPLTPADCDLRDFPYMPLDVLRLRDSDLAARTSGEEFRCAVLLWCASWHQVPAASLPDDDVNLAQYAGFGRAIDQWLQHKEGAMRGWVKCSDGRLYHAVVAEKANEAWQQKHVKAHEKLGERIRKRNKVRAEKGQSPLEIPDVDNWISMGRPVERDLFPEEFAASSAGNKKASAGKDMSGVRNGSQIPPENALKGTEQNRTERKDKTIGSNDDGGTPPARDEKSHAAAVEVSKSLREWEKARGKFPRNITPSQEQVIELAALEPTPDELRKAYELAVEARENASDPGPINAAFVRTKLEQLRRPPPPKREPQLSLQAMTDAQRDAVARDLGISGARAGESRDAFIARIQAKRAEAQGATA